MAALIVVVVVVVAEASGGSGAVHRSGRKQVARGAQTLAARRGTAPRLRVVSKRNVVPPRATSVGQLTVGFSDPSRTMVVQGRTSQRRFDAEVRYPVGPLGPFPVVIFGHGFNDTPDVYASLLDAWARAGYVVVAPIFPLENTNAPGGATRQDLGNQPGDISLVISELENPLTPGVEKVSRLSDLSRIAVSGQSDGGDTALAAAYGPQRDPRIAAAAILSGQQDPLIGSFRMPSSGPPLLAVQGTADTINLPSTTYEFFGEAAAPKYLLKLIGAGHQDPYVQPGAELAIVEKMTTAFLDRYLRSDPRRLEQLMREGSAGPGSVLSSDH